jgi:hypothetical protein
MRSVVVVVVGSNKEAVAASGFLRVTVVDNIPLVIWYIKMGILFLKVPFEVLDMAMDLVFLDVFLIYLSLCLGCKIIDVQYGSKLSKRLK